MALEQHQRPTAMLMRDPYAGHRDWYTGESDAPLNEWTSWDFALATATQLIIDGTTEYGNLRWEVEDDDADILVVHEINKEREAIGIIENGKDYKAGPGEWLRPTIIHPYWMAEKVGPEPWQSRTQWIEKMIEKEEAEGRTID